MGKFNGLTGVELFAVRAALRIAAANNPPHPLDPIALPYVELLKAAEEELKELTTQLIDKQKDESDGRT